MAGKKQESVAVGRVADFLEALAPPHLAQSWDNVGLLAGDRAAPCRRIILCVDLTPPVLKEAASRKTDLIVAYHPPLFRPVQRLLADSAGTDAIVYRAIASGMALYSPHTALDAVPGGTNDVLAALCDLRETEPFEYVTGTADAYKLVTFVPEAELERVASAIFAAGAGRIGEYEQCSYRLRGEGTFFGTEGTDPTVGRRGRLETVAEIRVETVVAKRVLPEVIDALLRSHSYEEPAYDIYPLADTPTFGIGRVGRLKPGTTLRGLARKLQKATGSKVMQLVGDPARRVERAAVCVGAAGRLPFEKPRSRDCDVVVTGEIRHHDALMLLRLGRTAIALGHWESERPALDVLANSLRKAFPGCTVTVSERDTGPFTRP